ncbi:MAG: cation diffusion facilitator family transporter [Bacteroidota bacterium]|nr:cation diffusion facilitator family transporter [Bacteroidota bacterium]MDP4251262.1 cation diffusion facilitator family transporter [Bacteroidota bacterium]
MEHAHPHSHSGHPHNHGHSHSHAVELKSVNTAFIIGIVLNLAFVVVEVIAGLIIHSLSLLSDAGHNLADVASLGLALFAFRMLKVKSNATYTYGYKKTTVLVALLNGGILLVSIGAILFESVQRLIDPQPLPGKTISLVAAIGILINGLTALLFFRSKENDLNMKGAFLHLMADAVVSGALVAGGILIYFTSWYWVDPLLGIIVAIAIVFSTWKLLRDSLRLSLDAVPQGIDLSSVRDVVKKIAGVRDFHHIHIWALSTLENALTGHVVLSREISIEDQERIKQEIKHQLLHCNIQHATLETETETLACESIPNH